MYPEIVFHSCDKVIWLCLEMRFYLKCLLSHRAPSTWKAAGQPRRSLRLRVLFLGTRDMSRPAQGGEGWVSGWRHTPLSLFNAPCLFTSTAMFYNILNSHIALLALSGAWDLALEWSCPLSVSRNE